MITPRLRCARGLTLHRPWPWAITALPEGKAKRPENRSWAAPQSVDTLLIHAGKTWDESAVAFMRRLGSEPPPKEEHPAGVIVAVADIAHCCDARVDRPRSICNRDML